MDIGRADTVDYFHVWNAIEIRANPNTVTFDAVSSIFWSIGNLSGVIGNGGALVITAKPMTAQHVLQHIKKYEINGLALISNYLIDF